MSAEDISSTRGGKFCRGGNTRTNVTNVTHGRTWMQAPTIDPGSKWYTDTSGVTAIPGVLTFVATTSTPYGYDHLRVLHPADSGPTA